MANEKASQVVEDFFEAYRMHDVERMVELCDDMASFRSVPFEMRRKQRVVRGDGKVISIGKIVWTGLIESFPDLTNSVTRILADDDGNVAAEVMISGTQAKPWGDIGSRGHAFRSPHLLVFHVNDRGKIDRIATYSDNASVRTQLGHLETD